MEESKFTLTGNTHTSNFSIPSEISNPIIQPTCPFMGPIAGGLKPNTAVFFQGAVPRNAKQFEINFHTGPNYSDGIAFYFNPRITNKYLYMNTYRNKIWEKDECINDKPIPKGTSFSLMIVAKPEGYEVHVNGIYYYIFQHRLPLEQVTTLGIRGDVFISICGFINNWSTSSLSAENSKATGLGSSFLKMLPIPSEISNPVINPSLPYIGLLPGGVNPGIALFVQGTVNPNANGLSIDFKTGPNPTDDIQFTFKPQIGSYVYMNNFIKGSWQREQFADIKPFVKGGTFSILIVLRADIFEVYVNGQRHSSFVYRMILGKITHLSIWGDACIHYFGYVYNWSRSPFFKKQVNTTNTFATSVSPLTKPSEDLNVVYQPKIPHVGPIPSLYSGMTIYVCGSVLTDDKQFGISLITKETFNADCAFMFNPRFDEYIYMNTYRNNQWEKEELVTNYPFIRGANFILMIVIKTEGYEVIVNGTSQCFYKHRMPLSTVEAICMWGGVSILYYGVITNWTASSIFKELSKTAGAGLSSSGKFVIPTELSNVIIRPILPYTGRAIGEVKYGMAVYVEGTATGNQFSINFNAGESKNDDVLMTFNPRTGQYLYLNSYRNGVWEKEQLIEIQPFFTKAAFNVLICITPECYEMYVNGKGHATFAHRIPYDRFKTLHIYGDADINFCGFLDNWRRSYIFRDQPKITDVGCSFSSLIPVPSQMSMTSFQPAIPYVFDFMGGVKKDIGILMQGFLPAHAKSFEINFKTSQFTNDLKNDIAFQFNPRIGQGVYMNSYIGESWRNEECVSDKPFVRGAALQLFIIITTEGYVVFVNGIKHCMFKHRFPVEKVTEVSILGDVSVLSLDFTWFLDKVTMSVSNASVMGSLVSRQLSLPSSLATPSIQPTSPYMSKLVGGLKVNMAVYFQGTVPMNAKGFKINFKAGMSDTDDIAFQYKPCDDKCVELNCFINGTWEKILTINGSAFSKGMSFYMFVVINSDNYEIFLNGFSTCKVTHRIPPEKVTTLGICGDISKLVYGVIDNWNTSYLCIDQSQTTGIGHAFSSLLANPSDLSHVVIQPTLPYVARIPGGLRTDMAVYIQGAIPAHAVIFEINLQTGLAPEDDIAFDINPRFVGEYVYLNSCAKGSWGNNENASIKPFQKETTFEMIIVIKSEGFEVYLNGMFYCFYKHRMHLNLICALSIYGDVSVPFYGYIDNWSKSSFIADGKKITSKGNQSLLPLPAEVSQPIIQPALPYVGSFTEGLKPDQAVFFKGTIPAYAKSFEINFKTGPSDGDDIAFHFNPCIGQLVNLTSFQNGKWDKREPTPEIPFFPGAALNMFVVISSEGYEVYVDGFPYCTFKHRIPLEKVSTLAIRGDLVLPICGITNNWKTSPFCLGPSTAASITLPKDGSYVIRNPIIPYANDLLIKQDMAILFQGSLPEHANSFEIHLKTGPKYLDDIAFTFNPRIGEYIYMNSYKKYKWENQETASDKPFSRRAAFQIILVIAAEGYEVHINGEKHCVFNHRIPIERVSKLLIFGDLYLSLFGCIKDWKTFSFKPTVSSEKTDEKMVTLITKPSDKEVTFPITNLTLPYVGKIPGGIKPDTAIIIKGILPDNTKGFEVNFKTGPSDNDDIAFQFNPRIGQNIYLNTFSNGKWEKEETAPDSPFDKKGDFQMTIVFQSKGYEVYVNDVKCYLFKHRIPLEQVSVLSFGGNVRLNVCNLIQNLKSLSFLADTETTTTTTTTTISLEVAHTVKKPTLPYMGHFPSKVKQNMAVLFEGTVLKDGKRFEINFKSGQGTKDDIAFHFNPRMERYTAFNTFKNGAWGKEEAVSNMPFTKGGDFQVIMAFKSEGYEVYVNGLNYYTFKHRIPFEKVSAIDIQGDVTMHNIYFIENWKSPSMTE